MSLVDPRNILVGPATVFVDINGQHDFSASNDIGATSPDGVRSIVEPDVPGFEVDQVNIFVGHTLNTLAPRFEFDIAEVTTLNMLRLIPGAASTDAGVSNVSGGAPGGDVLQTLAALITGSAPGGGTAKLLLPRCVPSGTTPVNFQRETNRVMAASLMGLLPDLEQSNLLGVGSNDNGDFDAATGWTTGAGWAIAGGIASATASTDVLSQDITAIEHIEYTVEFDVLNYSSGSVAVSIGGGTPGASVSADGTFRQDIIAGGTGTSLEFTAAGPATLDIDNVRVMAKWSYNLLYI